MLTRRFGESRPVPKRELLPLTSFDPAERARGGQALVELGVARSAKALLEHVSNEFDERVLAAIARAVTEQAVTLDEPRRVQQLRAWATEELERQVIEDAWLGTPAPEPALVGASAGAEATDVSPPSLPSPAEGSGGGPAPWAAPEARWAGDDPDVRASGPPAAGEDGTGDRSVSGPPPFVAYEAPPAPAVPGSDAGEPRPPGYISWRPPSVEDGEPTPPEAVVAEPVDAEPIAPAAPEPDPEPLAASTPVEPVPEPYAETAPEPSPAGTGRTLAERLKARNLY